MNLLQKRIAASIYFFFFIAVLLPVGFKFSSWPAALLCSVFCIAVQLLTFACSPKRDFVFLAISCVGGAMLAISHFQGGFSFAPDIALAISLLIVFVVKFISDVKSSSPVWTVAFIIVPLSLIAVRFWGFEIPAFQLSWDIAAICCIVATGLMGLIPFDKARMTTEYWVSSAVIACLAAFLAAAVSVCF